MPEQLQQSLELARLELLDMGLRGNTLLNLRQTANTLPVVDEISGEVYRILVQEQRGMSFLPVPEKDDGNDKGSDEAAADDEQQLSLPEQLEAMYGEARHTDTRLQTRLGNDALDRRLVKISNEAKTYYEEQGVDILYLALGFLTWFEDPNSTTERRAPLILVPVELKRATATDRFKLVYTEADIGPNMTLEAKLKSEFRIVLPGFPEELEPDAYYDAVADAVASHPRWRVEPNTISLGFFSFGKFQMYQDLDPENFQEGSKPWDHPIVKALLSGGFDEGSNQFSSSGSGSTEILPKLVDLNFVKDADSSQTEAVMAVKSGENLVIQGPPGTGKSQTITNIIAEMLGENKKVLFVAEKMAALEVVKRRLDECHLGEAALELHSHKSNRKAVLGELKRCLEVGTPKVPDRRYEQQRHQKLQQQLDDYCDSVNTPILNSGTTYVEALGQHLKLGEEVTQGALPAIDFSLMRDWSPTDYATTCDKISELVAHLEQMGTPARNPFASARLQDFSPIKQQDLVGKLNSAESLIQQCQQATADIAEAMGLSVPETLEDLYTLHRAATRAHQAPHVAGLKLTTDDWQQRRDRIRALVEAGTFMQDLQRRHADKLIDQAWAADVLSLRGPWATAGTKWWRFLSGDFRKAKRSLQGLVKGDLPKDADQCLSLVDDILAYQTFHKEYQKHEQLGASLFGAQWQGLQSDWPVLASLSEWVIDLYREVTNGSIPPAVLRFLEGDPELQDWATQLAEISGAAKKLEDAIQAVMKTAELELPGGEGVTPATVNLATLKEFINRWKDAIDELYPMARYNLIISTFHTPALKAVADLSFEWDRSPEQLLTTLQASWFAGLVEEAYTTRDAIRYFDRVSQEQSIQDFRRLDRELFTHAQEGLVEQLHQRLPSLGAGGEMATLRREMNKKRRHMALRKLIREAGRAIQEIKPVFMMSPMSVATYLEQGAVEFDVVIFDEASQVKVVDALGALLRGNQAVVVGDTKQMPPTDFFSRALELDDEEADASQTADIESILGMFLAQGATESMLRWHYRSRHDSLIAVSNEEFYDGKLMVFPSPGINPHASGLRFRHFPETRYDRGGSRTNVEEARAVAEAVIHHAKHRPQLSLGVVAFSTAQRDCLLLQVERLRREHPETEEFFAQERSDGESFFIKNLENVQGDERDIILISIGYGKSTEGRLSQSFGPVNRDGGERRLNVLITRARLGMEVFANFTGDELQTTSTTPFGVRALKNFLVYAESGELQRHQETGREADSPFEDEVLAAIRSLGYEAEPQVGSAGFFIDLAVRDPGKPGRYALAVECDGASYHSSANARDRDRLRQDVLEGLGWRFHRIWSTDWFRHPQAETQRLKEAIETSVEALASSATEEVIAVPNNHEPTPTAQISRDEPSDSSISAAKPYRVYEGSLGLPTRIEPHEFSDNVIHKAVKTLLEHEGPLHFDQAAKRLVNSVGITRVGKRINSRFYQAFSKGSANGVFCFEDPFLYPSSEATSPIRDRSNLPNTHKRIEHVPPAEIQAALIETVSGAFTIQREEAISASLSLLGFQRSTQKAVTQVDNVLSELIDDGVLIDTNNNLAVYQTSYAE
jgi:DNA polymerase III delta prime subunit/very-short-patch-repair endonuclease